MVNRKIKIHPSWSDKLEPEFDQPYMKDLFEFLDHEQAQAKTIYPAEENVFSALSLTALQSVRVVILGQDPYHGCGQAHGLSFSVPPGEKVPPSLKNIYKELNDDVGFTIPTHGNLTSWANQGVLLLNSVLTVREGEAGSHQGKGWEQFTDKIIQVVNELSYNVVFLLWGAYAQKKAAEVDGRRHLVLHAAHPSPLSAYRGFLGCGHFSKANQYLENAGLTPIDWQIT